MREITLETLYIYNIEEELKSIQLEPLSYPLLSDLKINGLNIEGKILWSGCLIL